MEVHTAYKLAITDRPQYTRHRVHNHKHNNSVTILSSVRLASSTSINIRHTNNSFSSSNNTEPKHTESYSRPNRFAGTQAFHLQIRRNHIGNGGPFRTRAADVGNVMCDETEFSVIEEQN